MLNEGQQHMELISKWKRQFKRLLDLSVPRYRERWALALVLLLLYVLRLWRVGGFYLVSYFAAFYLLRCGLMLITPSGPVEELPSTRGDEVRPFVAEKQEFGVWKSVCITFLVSIVATFFPFLDIPAYWPILLFYILFLVVFSVGAQISRMLRYNYVPWNTGKKKFVNRAQSTAV